MRKKKHKHTITKQVKWTVSIFYNLVIFFATNSKKNRKQYLIWRKLRNIKIDREIDKYKCMIFCFVFNLLWRERYSDLTNGIYILEILNIIIDGNICMNGLH